jgi:hypothetical protein
LAGIGVVLLAAGVAGLGLGQVSRGLAVAAGFTAIAIALAREGIGGMLPAALAGFFVLYGGVSAAVAAGTPIVDLDFESIVPLAGLGIVKVVRAPTGTPPIGAFDFALLLVVVSGAAAVAGAVAGGHLSGGAASWRRPSPRRLKLGAYALLAIGGVGVALAGVRLLQVAPGTPLWDTTRTLWHGGAYFVFLAHCALPGFGLLLACLLEEGADRRQLMPALAGLTGFVVLTVITGQRTFGIEAGLMLLALWIWRRGLRVRHALAFVTIGMVLLFLTQAVRNALQDTGRITVATVSGELSGPRRIGLLGNQFDAFPRTLDVARARGRIRGGSSLLDVVLKPVPRQLLDSKPAGFAERFTQAVHPDAITHGITLAVPLWAELDYDLGPVGATCGLFLLGLCGGWAARRARTAPPALRPLLGLAIFWSLFVFLRGDLSNAVVGALGWIIPVVAAALIGGGRAQLATSTSPDRLSPA